MRKPDDVIVQEGDDGTDFYFIAVGTCGIFHKHFPTQSKKKLLKAGNYFGELAVLFDCKRTCTIKSIDYTTLA